MSKSELRGRRGGEGRFETTNTPVEIPGGLATLGRDPEEGFGWDNEFEKHFVRVPAFCIDRYKVTNGDYLEFVKQGAKPPHFWTLRNGEWFLRGMFELIPLPLNAPVYVTRSEAEEYATWKNKQLPTEAQFHRAAYALATGSTNIPGETTSLRRGQGAFDFQSWDPVPVSATPDSDSHYGVAQMVGNGWEWTSTVFEPFPGFEPSANYPGYSQNFFDGHHYVLKGGILPDGETTDSSVVPKLVSPGLSVRLLDFPARRKLIRSSKYERPSLSPHPIRV